VAGDILDPNVGLKDKGKAGAQAAAFYSKWLPQRVVGKGQAKGTFNEFGDLAKHLRFAERGSRRLARSIFYLMGRWQAKLEKKQSFLGRIVDIGAELFAIASAVVYAKTIESEDASRAEEARELADLFCGQARRRVDRFFHDLWSNDDDANYKAAQRVLEGRYAWLEHGIVDPSGDGPMIAEQPGRGRDRAVGRRPIDRALRRRPAAGGREGPIASRDT